MTYCYINGQIVDEDSAFIPINNMGVQRGFGVFDFFRVRDGKPMFMKDHLDRFDQSQKFMDLAFTIGRDEIQQAIANLQKKNDFKYGGFKLVLLADDDDSDDLMPFFYILNTKLPKKKGSVPSRLISHEYLREFPHVKSVSYFQACLLRKEMKKAKAIDTVYHNNGMISEAARSSIFIVEGDKLLTPKTNILEGVTRKNILKFSSEIIETQITDISLDQLQQADEVFISSTLKEVMPITHLDGKQIGKGKIGPWTQKISDRFQKLLLS